MQTTHRANGDPWPEFGSRRNSYVCWGRTPFAALQKLVMSMADVTKNAGKTGLFGGNKGQEAYSRFLGIRRI